jgi:hypothetical protein
VEFDVRVFDHIDDVLQLVLVHASSHSARATHLTGLRRGNRPLCLLLWISRLNIRRKLLIVDPSIPPLVDKIDQLLNLMWRKPKVKICTGLSKLVVTDVPILVLIKHVEDIRQRPSSALQHPLERLDYCISWCKEFTELVKVD